MPPMTTLARGRWTSAPAPWERAIGTKPRAATRAVIMTGFSRVAAPRRIDARSSRWPSSRSRLMAAIITMPFRTATPKSAMKPTEAERLRLRPRIQRAAMPPTSAKGTLRMTSAAWRTRPKVRKSSRKMIASEAGITTMSRRVARCWFSNCPPHSTK